MKRSLISLIFIVSLVSISFHTARLIGASDAPTLLEATKFVNVQPGLQCRYYEGSFNSVNAIESGDLKSTTTVKDISLTAAKRNDQFGLIFDGFIKVPTDGTYTFYTTSDDGSQLLIDEQLVVDNDGNHSRRETNGQISLQAGLHAIQILFYEAGGDELLTVAYQGPGIEKQSIPADLYFTKFNPNPDIITLFARYPHICNGMITFTYQGDVWVASEDGNNPRRLTNHLGRDLYPRFSPDGKTIAFCSDRMGNFDIYTVPVSGGTPKQLTFMTVDDIMVNWTPDGKRIIFKSWRDETWYFRLYTISPEGDIPVPFEIDAGYSGSISQDGRYLAFNRYSMWYGRKHYKGNANTDIYLQNLETKNITQLTDINMKNFRSQTNDCFPMWGADGRIYFSSERDDTFNIWSLAPDDRNPKQYTYHAKDGVQYPSMSPDGKTIIYENGFELWKLSIPDGSPEKITLKFNFDPKENMVEYLHINSEADDYAVCPGGIFAAVCKHGEIFIVPIDKERGEKTQVTDNESRDRHIAFSPDGKYLSYVSDCSGDEEIWLYNMKDQTSRQLTKHESTKSQYRWTDDSKTIIWEGANTLFSSNVETGEATKLTYNAAYGFDVSDISKDGNWLVYSRNRDDNNQDVYIYNIQEKKEYNISNNAFYDNNGMFSNDEKTLIYTSNRNNGNRQLFAVPFEKVTVDKNDPLLKLKKDEKKDNSKDKKKDSPKLDKNNILFDIFKPKSKKDSKKEADSKKSKETKPIFKLDLDGIDRRAIQLTNRSSGVYSSFVVKDKVYYTSRENNNLVLYSVGIDGENDNRVSGGNFRGVKISPDDKMLVYNSNNRVYTLPLSSKKEKRLEFSFTIEIEKQKEWNQIFEESWRVMKYYFYDENMHGYDWDAIKSRYKPLVAYLSSYQDVYDLSNLMIGELNASHTGVSGPTRPKPNTYRTQLLGFDMVPDGDYYKVSHINWNGPADKEWIDLNVGDIVLSIDGKEIKTPENYWPILNDCLNDYVSVEVKASPEAEETRTIRINTVTSLSNTKYEEWVEKNRLYVKEKTNDKIAYVHIRAMNGSSLKRFENEINHYYNHKGIIVDIRHNRGGNIDQQILDILARRPYQYWNNRWSAPEMGRRHHQAIDGPKVMMINSRSASDSEVTPLGFQDLGLGLVVGNPTCGAVIATGSYGLINGGSIRRPGALVARYDPTKPHNYGLNLENYGVEPNVWVENSPNDNVHGRDPELDTAIERALEMLENYNMKKNRQ